MKQTFFSLFVLVLLGILPHNAIAGIADLPQTGQITCYDSNGDVIACTGTGQDGDQTMGVPWPSPRFQDNGDGTLTDLLTGHIWLADANCIATHYGSLAADGQVNWQTALTFVQGLNDGTYADCNAGHTDWRLPNLNELESLVDAKTANGSMLINAGFTDVVGAYWTSTHDPRLSPANALFVDLWGGTVSTADKVYTGAVLPVRAGQWDGVPDAPVPCNVAATGQTASHAAGDDGDLESGVLWPNPRFSDNTDGTITDNLTGLTWLQDANCIANHYSQLGTDGGVNWQSALGFIAGINDGTYSDCGAGQTDWRLPNRKEMRSLFDYSQANPALPAGHPFTNTSFSINGFWTGTSDAAQPDRAWQLYHRSGLLSAAPKTSDYLVWPVRGGSGTVISGGQISVTPLDIQFGDVAVGEASGAVEITISNVGDDLLSIFSISLEGIDTDDFTLNLSGGSNPCGQTDPQLDVETACSVTVAFAPLTEGAAEAVLSMLCDDADDPQVDVALSGNGTPAAVATFPDPGLESAIRTIIEQPEGDILQSSLVSVVELIAPDRSISNLSGLEYCTNLEHLNLSGNQISNLAPLAGLTSLTYLNLYDNSIEDISHLGTLTNLSYLNLQLNLIANIAALETLVNLEVLYLDENQIVDISPLTALLLLRDLGLSDNQVIDLTALVDNDGLVADDPSDRVWLEGNPLDTASTSQDARDIRSLQDRSVEVFHDPFDSLFGDSGLDTAIRNALELPPDAIILPDDLALLTYLDASNSIISDLSGIVYCQNLTELNLAFNRITSLADLSGLTSLNHLNLQDNHITDISPLAGLTNLTYLNLSVNQIEIIGSLSSLTGLTQLYLSNNQINDIAVISELTNLAALSLSGNQISDLSALLLNFGLSSGDSLWLADNPFEKWVGSTSVNQLWTLENSGVVIDCEEVYFLDDALTAAVRAALGGTITYAGVVSIETLDLSNQGILEIRGLEYFLSLTSLDLDRNDIDDITPLVDNTGLGDGDVVDLRVTHLDFWETSPDVQNIRILEARGATLYYDEITPVLFPDLNLAVAMSGVIGKLVEDITRADLEALIELDLSERNIQDITGLARCRNLENLNLSGNQIVEVPVRFYLFNLTHLDLSNNQLVNIAPLSACTALVNLNLSHNQIQNIEGLWNLVEMRNLYVEDNLIESLGALNQMEELRILDASENAIATVGSLQYNHAHLYDLFLDDNLIEDITPLAALNRLSQLHLQNNRITVIPPLASLTRLHTLLLSGNLISDISGLIGLESITTLWLSKNQIDDLSSLSGLVSLTTLSLNENLLVDIAPLATLVNLSSLSLADNQIVDISPLIGLIQLNYLYLINNQINDISALVNNAGFGEDDRIWIGGNDLDSWIEMPWWQDVYVLENRGVTMRCGPRAETPFTRTTTEQDVRQLLNIPEGLIRMSDLEAVTELDFSAYAGYGLIDDLEGFQHFKNVTDLNLNRDPDAYTTLLDLTPLASLTQLERLSLSNQWLSNMQPLRGLINLTFLSLNDTRLSSSDLNALSDLTNLTFLDVSRNDIVDINPLASLTNLTHLELGFNEISDLSPLAGLTALRHLNIGRNQISDISPFSGLINLTYLLIADNPINDIQPLIGLNSLETLHASGCQIADLTPLANGFPSMATLVLRDNHITDIQSLVDNLNFATDDTIYIDDNRLMLWIGSEDLADIDALKARGVDVRHDDPIVSDQDGVPDSEEQGPDGNDMEYDGNGDWIPDWGQHNVVSLHAANGVDYVTITCPWGDTITDVSSAEAPAPQDLPPDVDMSMGIFNFRIDGLGASGETTVTIYLPDGVTPQTYYKYGPTPGNAVDHWYEFLYDGDTGAEINGNVITLHFHDNRRGDHDLDVNYEINDPGGPAFVVSSPGDDDDDDDGGGAGCFIGTGL